LLVFRTKPELHTFISSFAASIWDHELTFGSL
jgi:hypothetical protein